jgi:hypothetical protein
MVFPGVSSRAEKVAGTGVAVLGDLLAEKVKGANLGIKFTDPLIHQPQVIVVVLSEIVSPCV